jgi:ABC-type transport system involved in cytochrome c biogenesis permease subunit
LVGIGRLPPLEVLERLHFRFQLGGFIALTLGIVFGGLWASTHFESNWQADPKILASVLIWIWYAIAVQSRLVLGWGGRVGALFSVVGFVGIVFSMVGITLLFSGWHGVGSAG